MGKKKKTEMVRTEHKQKRLRGGKNIRNCTRKVLMAQMTTIMWLHT